VGAGACVGDAGALVAAGAAVAAPEPDGAPVAAGGADSGTLPHAALSDSPTPAERSPRTFRRVNCRTAPVYAAW
jgi:hypothetical protein